MKKLVIIALALIFPSIVSAATLSVSPSTGQIKTGEVFSVQVMLDTKGKQIDGADLRYLRYNPSMLEVQQIIPGNLMSSTLANIVDSKNGQINFSQVITPGGTKYSGSGTLVTVVFRAFAAGTANVSLDYSVGSTIDSNVAVSGTDALNSVVNGSYVITGASVAPNTPVTAIGSNTTGSGYVFTNNLFLGAKGNDVTELQKFLVSKGYTTTDNITGYFGPVTQSALQKFQAAEGIVSSGNPTSTGYGFFGPATRTKVNQHLAIGGSSSGVAGVSGLTEAQIQAIKAQILVLQQQVLQLLAKLQAMQGSGL